VSYTVGVRAGHGSRVRGGCDAPWSLSPAVAGEAVPTPAVSTDQ
jgi:hypothetical protein